MAYKILNGHVILPRDLLPSPNMNRESFRDVSTVLVMEKVISYTSLTGSSPNIFREHMAPLFSDLREERELVIGTIITIIQ